MNIREVTGFTAIDNLDNQSYEDVLAWAGSWDSKLPNIPKSATIMNQLVHVATANGRQISDKNLDLAAAFLENEKRQGDIAQAWLRDSCPAGLKIDGKLSSDNLKLIGDAITQNYAGDLSKLPEAVAQLTKEKKLRYAAVTSVKDAKITKSITGRGHNALTSTSEGQEAITEWLKTAPRKLLGADGDVGDANASVIAAIIKNELGGRITVQTLQVAATLAASRKLLTYTEVSDPEAAARALELRDEKARSKSDEQNHHSKPDANKLKEAEEARALDRIDKVFKGASRDEKIEILQIVRRTKEASASPLVAQEELVAYASIQNLLAKPLGTKHHEQEVFRQNILDIIRDEQEHSRQHPETGIATWGRIARTVNERVTSRYSRGIR
jgi:hypothetical protein